MKHSASLHGPLADLHVAVLFIKKIHGGQCWYITVPLHRVCEMHTANKSSFVFSWTVVKAVSKSSSPSVQTGDRNIYTLHNSNVLNKL